MKILKYTLMLCVVLFSSEIALAQEWEQVEVPLTMPGAPGQLVTSIIDGSIEVLSHNKDIVIVEVKLKSGYSSHKKSDSKNGMKKVANNALQYTIKEIDNKVVVSYKPGAQKLDFRITVPQDFSLKLKTINLGHITVANVNGEHEISNLNGGITMTDISGSVIADALNKTIIVKFKTINPEASMAFTSLNGDVDVSFPSSLKATIDAESEFGDVYSDFTIVANKTQAKSSKGNNGVYKVTRKKGITGTVNGGGATISFKTLNGDIMIRSN